MVRILFRLKVLSIVSFRIVGDIFERIIRWDSVTSDFSSISVLFTFILLYLDIISVATLTDHR